MKANELAAVMQGIAPVVRDYVGKAFSDLASRIVTLETKQIVPARDGVPGRDGLTVVGPHGEKGDTGSRGLDGSPGPKGDPGPPGRSIDPADVVQMVSIYVDSAIAILPRAKDGQDGTSVTVHDVAPLIASEVTKQIAAITPPPDVPPEALIATFSGLLRKALPPFAAGPPLLLQKRVIRDRHGKVERVVEEVV